MADIRSLRRVVCVLSVAGVLSGCGIPPALVPPDDASSSSTANPSFTFPALETPDTGACTEMGNAEGVNLFLTGVLDPRGGGHAAQITLSTPATTMTTTVPTGGLPGTANAAWETDLTGQPLNVSVLVRDAGGELVYTGDGMATPQLFQPNGARCDGENYALPLVATLDGRLVPYPGGDAVKERGEQPFLLYTHCGIDELRFAGAWYQRVGGPLDDGNGNPPPGWDDPYQDGRVTGTGTTVIFTDDTGHRETFEQRAGATEPKRLCG